MRSFILVLGACSDGLTSALGSGADLIGIDMEDTVEDKAAARALADRFLQSSCESRQVVRINPIRTADGIRDLARLSDAAVKPDYVCVPKVEHPVDMEVYAAALPDTPAFVIIETPDALEAVFDIASAEAPISALCLGGKDLAQMLGAERSWDGLRYARGRIVQAAAQANLPVFDEPYRPLEDLDGLRDMCAKLREIGFTGKTTIVAEQVPFINEAFV